MLQKLSVEEARHVAGIAKAARIARDEILDHVSGEDLAEPKPARGEHEPARGIGLDPLPVDAPVRIALREAVGGLSSEARWELQALMAIGRGDFAAPDWPRAVSDAAAIGDDAAVDLLSDEPGLHEYLMKGLYELKLA